MRLSTCDASGCVLSDTPGTRSSRPDPTRVGAQPSDFTAHALPGTYGPVSGITPYLNYGAVTKDKSGYRDSQRIIAGAHSGAVNAPAAGPSVRDREREAGHAPQCAHENPAVHSAYSATGIGRLMQ